ncbi:MAG: alkaline phosphatase family protein, partial [Chloroflexota bacterium]
MNWKSQLVYPEYGVNGQSGRSIGNIGGTIAKLLGIPFQGLPALPETFLQPLLAKGKVDRVVLIIVDAMGQNLFDDHPLLTDLAARAAVTETITSVFPSTTVNALSSIWTGHAPAQHGLVGLRLLDTDFNAVNFMINLHPLYLRKKDAMVDAGFVPENYLAVPGIAQQFAKESVPTVDIKGREIVHSALSRMHGRGVAEKIGIVSFPEMIWQIKNQLETKTGPLVTVAYWPNVDTLSHLHGPHHPAVKAEMLSCLRELKENLLDGTSKEGKENTVVLLTADHGQVELFSKQHQYIDTHPDLNDLLLINAAGGNRVPYWYVKQGKVDQAKQLAHDIFKELALLLTREEILENGWFGPGPYAPKFEERIGDLNVLMADGLLMID